jgi:tRNA A-37 threonylcarbamoyl transferase component Bud32
MDQLPSENDAHSRLGVNPLPAGCPDDAGVLPTGVFHPTPTSPSTDDQARRAADGATPFSGLARPVADFGPYEILDEVRQGGMGVVYKARHRSLNRVVAVKTVRADLPAEAVRRFQQEARAVAHLAHPNVVPIFDFCEQNGRHYFVMAFAEGGSLSQHLEEYRADPRQAAALLGKVARAVHFVHKQGVLHRDLKPANILLDEHGEPLVSDFGLAKLRDAEVELTQTGEVLGTPVYMAPEQAAGRNADVCPQTDVWALGVILFQLLTGQRPFDHPSRERIFDLIQRAETPRLRALREDLDPVLEAICLKCLEKKLSRRYPSAEALADDLGRWLRGEPVAARPESWPARLLRRYRRHLTAAAAVFLVAAALVLALGYFAGRHPESAPASPPAAGRTVAGVLRVARSGDADYRSLTEALLHVGPGGTIRVLDDAVYREPVAIEDRTRMGGVTLVAERRATIAPLEGPYTAVSIRNTSGVTLKGFKVNPVAGQHGLMVLGKADGVTLEDLVITQPPESEWANVYFAEGAHGSAERPLRMRNCLIRSGKFGTYLGGSAGGVSWVRLEDNRFLGPVTHVLVDQPAQDLSIERNIFCDGVGVELRPPGPGSGRIRVSNNTFFQTSRWLRLAGADVGEDLLVCNNLVLQAEALDLNGKGAAALIAGRAFRNNLWEAGPGTNAAVAGQFAKLVPQVEVLSRDPSHPGFLRPPAGSPLARGGAGGELPHHVGARPPAEAPP